MTEIATTQGIASAPRPSAPYQDEQLRRASEQLEASFLSEMLKSAGLDGSAGGFGGGIGEEQFSSYLRDEQAKMMVKAGGIGLAQTLFEAMKGREG